jgi:hypothetical protein
MNMKVKTFEHDGTTYAVLKDGNPVYADTDGKEVTYDPVAMHTTIGRLNKESQTHREAKETAETALKIFGDLDPKAAKKALETVANLDDKKLIAAGEVDRVIKAKTDGLQVKLDESLAANVTLTTKYDTEKINSAFASSEYITEKLAVPSDMAQATFGKHFVFKEGVMTPVDVNGNVIYSDSNPGDIASFDEAMEKVVKTYPHRDSILKGTGHSGSGSKGHDGSNGEGRTMTRKAFEAETPLNQQKIATDPDVTLTD